MTGDTTISEKKVTVSMTNVSSDHNTVVGDPKILYGESGDAIGNVQLTIKPVLGYRIFAYQMGFTLLTGANAVTFIPTSCVLTGTTGTCGCVLCTRTFLSKG